MKPLDENGNPLEKGDLVITIWQNGTYLCAIVQDITEGGIIAPGVSIDPKGVLKGMEMPGTITFAYFPKTIPFNSSKMTNLSGVFKIVRPPSLDKKNQA